jgi:formylglycine-generating enzyme required for sulfatase activity
MSTKVFISYRRDDSAGHAGRVHDRLVQELGRDVLFMDVDGIPLGADFVEVLRAEVAACDVLLAIIGPDWLEALDEAGNRRLENAHDFVRIEIATALKRGIPVIPILLEGTAMPEAEHLPDDLKALARRQALDVSHASFQTDLDKLVRQLRGTIGPPKSGLSPAALESRDTGGDPQADDATKAHSLASASKVLAGMGMVVAATVLGAFYYVNGWSNGNKGDGRQEFTDCEQGCPVMVVLPAGKLTMGSPARELGRDSDEGPQREVTIAKPFAVSKYEVTFAEWDACVEASACPRAEAVWGHGPMPVIYASWNDAKRYVSWLSRSTGKEYRLLSEAEWEYAARAGTQTRFSWGDEPGKSNANCRGCGSEWDGKQTAPAGSFAPNAFGLYDMNGNVWEWVEDTWHDSYKGAPTDGSAWTEGGDPRSRVKRGGSWDEGPHALRVANRSRNSPGYVEIDVGFRVARTLPP